MGKLHWSDIFDASKRTGRSRQDIANERDVQQAQFDAAQAQQTFFREMQDRADTARKDAIRQAEDEARFQRQQGYRQERADREIAIFEARQDRITKVYDLWYDARAIMIDKGINVLPMK
jgi:hypothetical protein